LSPQIGNPQIAEIYGLQIANPQTAKFAEGLQILNKFQFANMQISGFADFQFEELICGPLTFGNKLMKKIPIQKFCKVVSIPVWDVLDSITL
jgi:hypothetical protein